MSGPPQGPKAPAATEAHVAALLHEAARVTTQREGAHIEVQLGHFCNNRCVFCASGQLTESGRSSTRPPARA